MIQCDVERQSFKSSIETTFPTPDLYRLASGIEGKGSFYITRDELSGVRGGLNQEEVTAFDGIFPFPLSYIVNTCLMVRRDKNGRLDRFFSLVSKTQEDNNIYLLLTSIDYRGSMNRSSFSVGPENTLLLSYRMEHFFGNSNPVRGLDNLPQSEANEFQYRVLERLLVQVKDKAE